MIHWLIGAPLGVLAAFATFIALSYQVQYGWNRDTSLMGLVYATILVGSILLVARREAGRRVLRGVSVAFAIFFGILAVTWPSLFLSPLECLMGIATSILIGGVLSLPSVRTAMRNVREAQ